MNIFSFFNTKKIEYPERVEKERDFIMVFRLVIPMGSLKATTNVHQTSEMKITIKAKNLESAKAKLKEWVNTNTKVYLESYDDKEQKNGNRPIITIPNIVDEFI